MGLCELLLPITRITFAQLTRKRKQSKERKFVRKFLIDVNLRCLLSLIKYALSLIAFHFAFLVSTVSTRAKKKYLLSLKIKLKSFVGLRRNHFCKSREKKIIKTIKVKSFEGGGQINQSSAWADV